LSRLDRRLVIFFVKKLLMISIHPDFEVMDEFSFEVPSSICYLP
jgi:hypothetical protein